MQNFKFENNLKFLESAFISHAQHDVINARRRCTALNPRTSDTETLKPPPKNIKQI